MSGVSKKLIGPFLLLWGIALVASGSTPAGAGTGLVVAMAAVFVGIVISIAASNLVSELREIRTQLAKRVQQDSSKEEAESWK